MENTKNTYIDKDWFQRLIDRDPSALFGTESLFEFRKRMERMERMKLMERDEEWERKQYLQEIYQPPINSDEVSAEKIPDLIPSRIGYPIQEEYLEKEASQARLQMGRVQRWMEDEEFSKSFPISVKNEHISP